MFNRKTIIALIVFILSTSLIIVFRFSSPAVAEETPTATEGAITECEALRTIAKPVATLEATAEAVVIKLPSTSGGPGKALQLVGNPGSGEKIYIETCQRCHGEQGRGGVSNPGSDDAEIPALNPINKTLADVDPLVYACNLDLFIEHGSLPAGPSPDQTMPNWGDGTELSPQEIADVIAYIVKLNNGPLLTEIATPGK